MARREKAPLYIVFFSGFDGNLLDHSLFSFFCFLAVGGKWLTIRNIISIHFAYIYGTRMSVFSEVSRYTAELLKIE